MRVFAISDIHGNNELFRKSLKKIGLKKSDKLFILGDLIDRGKESKEVLDTIILLHSHGFDVQCILGNHEQMLLDSILDKNIFNQWVLNGGDKTLLSFLTNSVEKIPIKYIDLLSSFKKYILYDNYILVHAALNMNIDDPFSDLNVIQWERNPRKFLNLNWLNGRKLIHGHTPKSKDNIINSINQNDEIICIDNGNFLKRDGYGALCILELKSLQINFIE